MDMNNLKWQGYVKSKKLVFPTKKRKMFIKLLNVALVWAVVGSVYSVVTKGDWMSVLGLAIPFLIVRNYKSRKESTVHCDPCAVKVSLNLQGVELDYSHADKTNKMEFFFNGLELAEYDKENKHLRLVGYDVISKKRIDHILYLEQENEANEFLNEFELCSQGKVSYIVV